MHVIAHIWVTLINVKQKSKKYIRAATVLLLYTAQQRFKDLKRRGTSINDENCSVKFE